MKRNCSLTRRALWRLRPLGALLAIVGQLGISGASITLARDESSAASHAEQRGIDLHHGHNEATCAACTALSFQASLNPIASPNPDVEISRAVRRCDAHRVTSPQLASISCRAPPRESCNRRSV